MLARGILGSGRTCGVSFWPFPNSSGWQWLIRISYHKTTHANGYYGAWPRWAVSISVLPLTRVLEWLAIAYSGRRTIPTIWGKGWRFPGIQLPPTFWSFDGDMGLSWNLWVCHLACWLRIKVWSKLTCLPSWTHLILISLCCVLRLCHSLESFALPCPPPSPQPFFPGWFKINGLWGL